MQRIEDRSYAVRTSSGRASSRRNWVGTMWLWVTRYRSTRRSVSSGSQRSISTTGCPSWTEIVAKFSTAVWYSGDEHRCTCPSNGCMPKIPKNHVAVGGSWSGSAPLSGRRTPFGRPDVPDVYTIGAPIVRPSGRPEPPAPRSANGRKPGTAPTANRAGAGIPAVSAASTAVPAKRSCAMNAFAPQSPRM